MDLIIKSIGVLFCVFGTSSTAMDTQEDQRGWSRSCEQSRLLDGGTLFRYHTGFHLQRHGCYWWLPRATGDCTRNIVLPWKCVWKCNVWLLLVGIHRTCALVRIGPTCAITEKVPEGEGQSSSNIPMLAQVWAFPERPGNLWTTQSVKDLSGTWLTERYLPAITVCGNNTWRHRHLQFHGLWGTLSVELYSLQCYCRMRTNFRWRQRPLHPSDSSLMSLITLLD